jgi:hypothetical protein
LIVGLDTGPGGNVATHGVALGACVSGAELVAGFARGELFAFPLLQRRGLVQMPEQLDKKDLPPGAKWNLRAKHYELLGVIAGATIGLKVPGVVATKAELGALLALGDYRIGELVADLRCWGLVHVLAVDAPFGRVTSDRANCYRLTTVAQQALRLVVPHKLPEPDADALAAPRGRYAKKAAKRAPAAAQASAPLEIVEPAPEIDRGHAPCNLAGGKNPTNPETPNGDSPEEPAAFPGVVSATPTVDFTAAVPDVAPCGPIAGRVKPSTAALAPEGVEIACASRLSNVLPAVKRGDHAADYVRERPERETVEEEAVTEAIRASRVRGTTPREDGRDRELVRRRANELYDQADERGRVTRSPAAPPAGSAPPPAVDDAPEAVDPIARYRAELAAWKRENPPLVVRRPREVVSDDDLADTIAGAFANRGFCPEAALFELRRRDKRGQS